MERGPHLVGLRGEFYDFIQKITPFEEDVLPTLICIVAKLTPFFLQGHLCCIYNFRDDIWWGLMGKKLKQCVCWRDVCIY